MGDDDANADNDQIEQLLNHVVDDNQFIHFLQVDAPHKQEILC